MSQYRFPFHPATQSTRVRRQKSATFHYPQRSHSEFQENLSKASSHLEFEENFGHLESKKSLASKRATDFHSKSSSPKIPSVSPELLATGLESKTRHTHEQVHVKKPSSQWCSQKGRKTAPHWELVERASDLDLLLADLKQEKGESGLSRSPEEHEIDLYLQSKKRENNGTFISGELLKTSPSGAEVRQLLML